MSKNGIKYLTISAFIVLWTLMSCVFAATVSVPLWLPYFLFNRGAYVGTRCMLLMSILFAAGTLAELLLWQANGFLLSIKNKNPFVTDNYKRLRNVGIFSLLIMLLFITSLFVYTTIFTAVFVGTFSVVSIIAFIVADLFCEAIRFKEENELTI